ncbi:HAMP domain-containing methyl-accepting chemotaxis protein [Methylobacterium nonmethylotrophicum]|uniref:Methyl-accepting chemotaxis protein n=1 Tax=Methylobacterium nonmethylotrophicum TaxID=1141884 RepID=A0A4Z0NJ29_9HYPH|nr:methyl-accepting chemotaxis protein [Methylobacterium nonmethylotrophicum]TGD96142.1 methyl-accepting chemotaxis protein [Methylobacterium nonmethylotrophicum]
MPMMVLTRLTGRFLTLSLLLGAIMVGLCAHTLMRFEESAETTARIGSRILPVVDRLGDLRATMTRVRLGATRVIDAADPAEMARARERNEARIAEMQGLVEGFRSLPLTPAEREAFDGFTRTWTAYLAQQTGAFGQAARDPAAAKAVFNGPANKAYDQAWKELERLKAGFAEEAAAAVAASEAARAGTERTVIVATAGGVILAMLLMGWLARDIAGRAVRLAATMRQLAEGNSETAIPCTGRRDEIGEIAEAAIGFRESLRRNRALEAEAEAAREGLEAQRRQAMGEVADAFERAVGGVVSAVSASADRLQRAARTMSAVAAETSARSGAAAAAARDASANVGMVAAAAEELGASVDEIGRQVGGSADLAREAVGEADATATHVQALSEAAARIGDVVALISAIAGQTNLLALNATIEAARAGEAGRGFSVVAAEVKGLSAQTSRATAEITGQIGQIQAATDRAVAAISGISGRIRELNGVAASIAAAVEQQGAATQEIVRNVTEAAAGTGAVTGTIGEVAGAAHETGQAAGQVLDAASALSREAEHLSAEVGRFLATVRAA